MKHLHTYSPPGFERLDILKQVTNYGGSRWLLRRYGCNIRHLEISISWRKKDVG
ncbi:hypothetical protein YC2023_054637 [Brassica napus]